MTSFEISTRISARYIELKYGEADSQDWLELTKEAGRCLRVIQAEKNEIYSDGPRVHGRAQQSRLDVLDERQFRVTAVFDNALAMI